MANKKIDMSKLRQFLRLYTEGEKKFKISELTGIPAHELFGENLFSLLSKLLFKKLILHL